MKNQKKLKVSSDMTSYARAFYRHVVYDSTIYGFHPKNTGLGKKETSFYKGFVHVRFDRNTLPKSGKSSINGCFVETKPYGYLVWEKDSRALLGIVKHESELDNKTKEWKRGFDDLQKSYR